MYKRLNARKKIHDLIQCKKKKPDQQEQRI